MNIPHPYKKILVFVFLFMFFVLFGVSWYIHEVQSSYIQNTKLKIANQETLLTSISLLTDQDNADAVVGTIIKDCSVENRERFDMLLGKLSQLKGQELAEMDQLFNACGDFYAVRKAVMVSRLQREYETYLNYIELLSLADGKAKNISYDVKGWGDLVALEVTQSELSTKLVDLQGKIIRALRQNVTISSEEMQSMLVEGQKTKDALIANSTLINLQRQDILNL